MSWELTSLDRFVDEGLSKEVTAPPIRSYRTQDSGGILDEIMEVVATGSKPDGQEQ